MKHKTIILPYEGYNFQVLVGYHNNISGIYLVDVTLTNKVSQPVNSQEFFHTLQNLRNKIINKEFDAEIKKILINSISQNRKNKCKKNIFILAIFTMLFLSMAVYFIMRLI